MRGIPMSWVWCRCGGCWRLLRRTVRSGTLIVLAAVLAAAGGCDKDTTSNELPPGDEPAPAVEPPAKPIPRVPAPVVQIWRSEATGAGISAKDADQVVTLLLDAEPRAKDPVSGAWAADLTGALRRFLKSEKDCFTDRHARVHSDYVRNPWLVEGKRYWMAWLLARAVARGEMTAARSKEVTAAFGSIVEEIAAKLDPVLAGEFRRRSLVQFKSLHADALYPAMKEPLSPQARKALRERFTAITGRAKAEMKDIKAKFGSTPALLASETASIARSLVTALIFQLTYDQIGPSRTEYWGTMKVVAYGPGDGPISPNGTGHPAGSRWPVSVAIIPDEAMNKLLGWRRGVAPPTSTRPIAASRPSSTRPSTRPASKSPPSGTLESDWSPPVGGLRGRLITGPYVAKQLTIKVGLTVWSNADKPMEIDADFTRSLRWMLLDAQGKEIAPVPTSAAPPQPRWIDLGPWEYATRAVGDSRWDERLGLVLDLGGSTWPLTRGEHTLTCRIVVDAKDVAKRTRAWVGGLKIEPRRFEVFLPTSDDDLHTAAIAMGAKYASSPEDQKWNALAKLVVPGLTVRQMYIALPMAGREKPQVEKTGNYFQINYLLSRSNFRTKASGTVLPGKEKEEWIVTSSPVILPNR